ncbi:MAG: hypothetical protein ABI035_04595 [Gemmatimonadaceae bacterium]
MRRFIAVLIACFVCASAGAAQSARVDLVLPAAAELSTEPPTVRTIGVLSAGRTSELIRNGFPARLHYKLERWAAGTFVNDVKATAEWEFIVQYDPLAKTYKLIRATNQNAVALGQYDSLADVDAKLAEPYSPRLSTPKRGEKSYYVLSLSVEAMSMSDLDEVQRWLRGELRPAVQGHRNAGAAVSSGLRALVVRILGGERIVYQASTGVFRP